MNVLAPPVVLVVEDERAIRALVVEILKGEGYRVAQASNGLEALDCLRQMRPAAIVLDVSMPEVDGLQFLECYEHLTGGRVPTIVTSAELSPSVLRRIRRFDIEGCLEKPFDLNELLRLVRQAVAVRFAARATHTHERPLSHLQGLVDLVTRRLDGSHALMIRAEDSLGWSQTQIAEYYTRRGLAFDGSNEWRSESTS